MSTQRQPTVVFDTVLMLFDLIDQVEFPSLLADTGQNINTANVKVVLGELLVGADGTLTLPARETVLVTCAVADDDQSVWPEKGLNTKRETFTTELVVATSIPNRSARQAYERCKTLVGTIDATMRDLQTGRPAVPAELTAVGVTSWAVSSVDTVLYPTGEGFVASAVVGIAVVAHI